MGALCEYTHLSRTSSQRKTHRYGNDISPLSLDWFFLDSEISKLWKSSRGLQNHAFWHRTGSLNLTFLPIWPRNEMAFKLDFKFRPRKNWFLNFASDFDFEMAEF